MGIVLAFATTSAACQRSPKGPPPAERAGASSASVLVDAAPVKADTPHAPTATVAVKGPVDRAKAEGIALLYARVHWSRYRPALATAFNTGHGEYRVVVGFDGRPDGASVFVRNDDGQVLDASILPRDD